LRVLQQPNDVPGYVSKLEGTVTQFQSAKGYAFLAQNYASGRYFDDLQLSDRLEVRLSDDTINDYTVAEIHKYQAVDPESETSEFIDLETGELLTAHELFTMMYSDDTAIVLQTCIEQGEVKSWGRLFIIAR
jgi:hypothetical protein